jgi:hypothetical protein
VSSDASSLWRKTPYPGEHAYCSGGSFGNAELLGSLARRLSASDRRRYPRFAERDAEKIAD